MAKDDPRAAAKTLILFKDKYLLLLRNDKEDILPSEWDMPGGGIEPGETIREALIREVKEETGIDISSSKIFPFKNWEIKKGKTKVSGTDFLCILSHCQEITLSAEHSRARWCSKEEIFSNIEFPAWLKENVELADVVAKEFENKKPLRFNVE